MYINKHIFENNTFWLFQFFHTEVKFKIGTYFWIKSPQKYRLAHLKNININIYATLSSDLYIFMKGANKHWQTNKKSKMA